MSILDLCVNSPDGNGKLCEVKITFSCCKKATAGALFGA
jgi:hypothetical protein